MTTVDICNKVLHSRRLHAIRQGVEMGYIKSVKKEKTPRSCGRYYYYIYTLTPKGKNLIDKLELIMSRKGTNLKSEYVFI